MNDALIEYLSGFVTDSRLRLFDESLRQRTRHIAVVLEDIFQPHNASACLRSCDAFGVQDVHLIENRYEYRLNPDVELGSAQWLTLHYHSLTDDNTAACIRTLRGRGYRIVATSPDAGASPLAECDVEEPTALLFGTEDEGLSNTALALADECIRIPTYGFVESLNLSVAAAIVVQELTGRMRESPVDWSLSDDERDELKLEWIRRTIGPKRLPIIEAEFARRRRNSEVATEDG